MPYLLQAVLIADIDPGTGMTLPGDPPGGHGPPEQRHEGESAGPASIEELSAVDADAAESQALAPGVATDPDAIETEVTVRIVGRICDHDEVRKTARGAAQRGWREVRPGRQP